MERQAAREAARETDVKSINRSFREEHLTRYRLISVKIMPATNNRSTRIQFTDHRNCNQRKVIRYNHEGPRDAFDQAELYLRAIGIKLAGITSTAPSGTYCCFLTEDFVTPIR